MAWARWSRRWTIAACPRSWSSHTTLSKRTVTGAMARHGYGHRQSLPASVRGLAYHCGHARPSQTGFATISLFSGAGGLDVGLDQTGGFELLACVRSELVATLA